MHAVAAPSNVNPEARMLIDGKLVESSTGQTFTNVNPATELVTMLLGMRQYQAAQRTMETIGNAMKERMEVGAGG